MKQCTKCKKLKSKSEFSKNRKNKDGLQCRCRKCIRNFARKHYWGNSKPLKRYLRYEERHRTIDGVKQKRCSKCEKWKEESKFGKKTSQKDGLKSWCKDCVRANMRERYKKEGKGLKIYYRYDECHRVVDGVKQKRCRRCKRWKAESEFYKNQQRKDGLGERCKECSYKARKSHKKRRTAVRN